MDHAQVAEMSREHLDTPGESGQLVKNPPRKAKNQKTIKFSTPHPMESCEICGKSFKKGRGLSIHQTKAGCKSVLENRIKNKSKSSGLHDSNHSGSTEVNTQDRLPLKSETSHNEERESIQIQVKTDSSVPKEKRELTNDHAKRKVENRMAESPAKDSTITIESRPSTKKTISTTPICLPMQEQSEHAPKKEEIPFLKSPQKREQLDDAPKEEELTTSRSPPKQETTVDAPRNEKDLKVKKLHSIKKYFNSSDKPNILTRGQVPPGKLKVISAEVKKTKAEQQDIRQWGKKKKLQQACGSYTGN